MGVGGGEEREEDDCIYIDACVKTQKATCTYNPLAVCHLLPDVPRACVATL